MAIAEKTRLEPPTEEQLLDEFEAERPGRKLTGFPGTGVGVLGAGLTLFAVYWVLNPMPAQVYRPAFLAVALLLTFLVFGGHGRTTPAEDPAERPSALDWALALLALVAVGYAAVTADELVRRAADPEPLDVLFGVLSVA